MPGTVNIPDNLTVDTMLAHPNEHVSTRQFEIHTAEIKARIYKKDEGVGDDISSG